MVDGRFGGRQAENEFLPERRIKETYQVWQRSMVEEGQTPSLIRGHDPLGLGGEGGPEGEPGADLGDGPVHVVSTCPAGAGAVVTGTGGFVTFDPTSSMGADQSWVNRMVIYTYRQVRQPFRDLVDVFFRVLEGIAGLVMGCVWAVFIFNIGMAGVKNGGGTTRTALNMCGAGR